ncbi:LuxR family transcriptional regulator [uncultured Thalassospira sp.]|jgi:LuxR family transcriptional regulator|uniref:LuxR family transcriptional regulator n=1 Tax=uncultured Thalassospira sp. TaxID=404382 RepID=UPI0030DA0AAD|tara:strand:+ start:9327 stop:10088 length:762 start_codon:yes stop_codon:yes gene_type:complete
MQFQIDAWEHAFNDASGISASIDRCFDFAQDLGFDAIAYDFSPVPATPEGEMLIPNIVQMRNIPKEMPDLWCNQGYYRDDPVQNLALKVSRPFFWSYRREEPSFIIDMLDGEAKRVTGALNDWHLTRGITVPLHLPGNRFATLTGFWNDSGFKACGPDRSANISGIALLAQVLHHHLFPRFERKDLLPYGAKLTPREEECILLAAEGLASKQIAWRLQRSESTIVMHLASATRKLGARNRAQAIARAAHYGYL